MVLDEKVKDRCQLLPSSLLFSWPACPDLHCHALTACHSAAEMTVRVGAIKLA